MRRCLECNFKLWPGDGILDSGPEDDVYPFVPGSQSSQWRAALTRDGSTIAFSTGGAAATPTTACSTRRPRGDDLPGRHQLGTATPIRNQVNRIYAVLPDLKDVLFTVVNRPASTDGICLYSKLPL